MRRVPMHAVDAERFLLGGLLIDPRRIVEVEHLGVADFYDARHQAIWRAMGAMEGKAFDVPSLQAKLSAMGLLSDATEAALAEAEQQALSASSIAAHAAVILDRSVRRRIVEAAEKIQGLATRPSDSTVELLDEVAKEIAKVTDGAVRAGSKDPVDSVVAAREALAHVNALRKLDGGMSGLSFGLPTLDAKTAGLNPGELWVLAARPGIGKSALALNVAIAASRDGKASALIHSLEMQRRELALRAICGEAQIPLERIRRGRLSHHEMDRIVQSSATTSSLPIWWDDDASVTILDLRAKARRLKRMDPKLGLIVVDYLQLVRSTGRATQRHLEVAETTRGLKELAKELGVAILALSQLSRDVEKANRKPKPSDLRESGSIEQDADAILFIHREEDAKPIGESGAVACELLVGKQRNGDAGISIPVTFQSKWTTFEDGQLPPSPPPPEVQHGYFASRHRRRAS